MRSFSNGHGIGTIAGMLCLYNMSGASPKLKLMMDQVCRSRADSTYYINALMFPLLAEFPNDGGHRIV